MHVAPPITPPEQVDAALARRGCAVLSTAGVAAWSGVPSAALDGFSPFWDDLRPDTYLKDGGRYRQRRHSCFVADGDAVTPVPHRAHWQPLEYNALHGGMQRWFEPVAPGLAAQAHWLQLLAALARAATAMRSTGAQPTQRWFVEAHQFRIDTAGGIGRPTPEGAHRDGVDLVAVFLVSRANIKGGETRVFDASGPAGERFTLTEPWSVLLLDDARVIHETTPIQPVDAGVQGHRDTLVVTCRAGGFQGD